MAISKKLAGEHDIFLQNLSAVDITFGFVRKEYILINHLILLAKQMIYQCRGLNIKPSLTLLLAKIRYTFKLESLIAKNQNSLEIHNKKWQPLLSIYIFLLTTASIGR